MEGGDQVQFISVRQHRRMGAGLVKILAAFNHGSAEGTHGGILFHRVAFRHHDPDWKAYAARCQCEALAVIAACGCDQAFGARFAGQQTLHIQQAAAHFEGTGGRVVFMLDPYRATHAFGQQRPGQLRCGRQGLVHGMGCKAKGIQIKHGTPSSRDLTRF